MKYILACMIVAGLAGSSVAQTVAQSQHVTLKATKVPTVIATPVKPVESVVQKAATKPNSSSAVAKPDVLVRPATPAVAAKPQRPAVAAAPIGTLTKDQSQKQ